MNTAEEDIRINLPNMPDDVLRIVVTDASTDTAIAFLYRMFSDEIFGKDQSILLVLYETPNKVKFLKSHRIQLTSSSPNMLWGVEYTDDLAYAFNDVDVAICIGKARAYEFTKEEFSDYFFKECVLVMKSYGEHIERFAKRDVKIIVLGNTAATIISRYATSIPIKNITAVTMFNLKLSAAHIAEQANCRPDQIRNLIIWGTNNNHTFPDCRYLRITNSSGMTDDLRMWMLSDLPKIIQSTSNRSRYTRSLAFALADHCKLLWNGTQSDEWTCMGVLSDNSYGVHRGIFFSYPVRCSNKQYEIVQELSNKENVKSHIRSLSKIITREVRAAFKICALKFQYLATEGRPPPRRHTGRFHARELKNIDRLTL